VDARTKIVAARVLGEMRRSLMYAGNHALDHQKNYLDRTKQQHFSST